MQDTRKTVGIFTIEERFLLSNYGSFFQHWALRQTLKRIGAFPFRYRRDFAKGRVIGLTSIFWALIARPRMVSFLKYKNLRALSVARLWRQVRSVWDFVRDYRSIVGPICERSGVENVAIVGGDQPWNSDKDGIFLENVPSGVEKVSYSVSTDWRKRCADRQWRLRACAELPRFSRLSVREQLGKECLLSIVNEKPIDVCIDPVLLLTSEDYLQMTSSERIFKKRTLLFYAVNIKSNGKHYSRTMRALADGLNCELAVIAIQGSELFLDAETMIYPAPKDFVRCFRDASYVVTNSFHGLVFATLFNRDFLFIKQMSQGTNDQNMRQHEYLDRIHCKERLWDVDDVASGVAILTNGEIDWESVNMRVAEGRAKSIGWIAEACR